MVDGGELYWINMKCEIEYTGDVKRQKTKEKKTNENSNVDGREQISQEQIRKQW